MFLSKAYQKKKRKNTNMYISRQFVLQYFSEIKQKKHQKLYIFQPKKMFKKITYQVNLIYLPSKFNLLTK